MGWLYKKSEAATTLLIIIVIVFFLGWLINVSQRECKTNKECGSEAYCGSDFSCHAYPTIQKTVVQYNLFWPAVIIGFAIVVAAIIFKRNKTATKEKSAEEYLADNVKVPEEAAESYYKGNNNFKTP
ncbi:hypothetical protein HYX03_01800 [Candidatus Woesearchaeota archaeon]|nr:hypothetical protein [Candidatus Woesearchaeota archaeon]